MATGLEPIPSDLESDILPIKLRHISARTESNHHHPVMSGMLCLLSYWPLKKFLICIFRHRANSTPQKMQKQKISELNYFFYVYLNISY